MAITGEKHEFIVLGIKYNSMKNMDNRNKKAAGTSPCGRFKNA
ncbi:Uncharacterised protein [Serratia quinivorans]|jgi:hypothetical protein|nr:hypothetical protein [Serratia quinivorans]CAI0905614.1 Uncharacterised protein [Serratia quinivorans]CAI1141787.1 Uncharacterised protein [Serratia quinivorans]CAI1185435.1 Uncharacterised protein [Serratia quinivorans]CAI1916163.1 Uncharacterised protein [Serratia quinivorans]CAI2004486.1 Uncharacterised protein [Serratia quinivorans]